MLRHFRLLALAAAFLATAAAAQSPATVPPGAGQGTRPAPLAYRSPLAGYDTFTEEDVISWREANDTVGRIGGWREYAREGAQPPSPSGGAAAAASSMEAPGGTAAAKPAAAPGSPATRAAPAPAAGHGGHQH